MTNALTNQLNGDAAVDLDLSKLHLTTLELHLLSKIVGAKMTV